VFPERTLFVHNQRVDEPIKGKDYAVMTSRWRLIGGRALYDLTQDGEQRRDVSADHPEIVQALSREYERWWEDISARFAEYVWIPVGTEQADPVALTSHDIHGQVSWDQVHAKRNSKCDGFWTVEVVRDGQYEIRVCRWPEEAGLSLRDAPEGFKAFAPTHARLKVGDVDETRPVAPGAKAVMFSVRLRKQRTRLQAWLVNDIENGETNGAFYVYVKRLE
jgi:arylsulfatase B